jgi:hypothetical protein
MRHAPLSAIVSQAGRLLALPILAGVAFAGAPATAQAHAGRGDHGLSCDVHSDWSVRAYRNAFLFTREGSPHEVGIGGGRLFVDGREVRVSAADHARLAAMESEFHALAPEMRQVVGEAVEIAFAALTEVARGLSGDPGQTVADLDAAHRRVRARMASADLALFNKDALSDVVQPILRDYLPDIIGGAVRTAIKAAFSTGKEAGELQARIDRMQHELDQRVDARAKALEPLARHMCARLRRIDALDDALEARTAAGRPYDLLEAKVRKDDGDDRDDDGDGAEPDGDHAHGAGDDDIVRN